MGNKHQIDLNREITWHSVLKTLGAISVAGLPLRTGRSRYAHQHGVINNVSHWSNDNITFLELLKKGGYDTAFIEKWHMSGKFPNLRGVDEFSTFNMVKGDTGTAQ